MEDKIRSLEIKITDLEIDIRNLKTKGSTQSPELGELFAALAKAQSEIGTAALDKANPFFKNRYSSLSSVINMSRPSLTKNGLCVIQQIVTNGDNHGVMITKLCHASGQWIESKMKIAPVKADIQSLGSYLSYVRRYCYMSLVGIASGDSEEDDGEAAMGRTHAPAPKMLTPTQVDEIESIIGADASLRMEIFRIKKISSLDQLPADCYKGILKWIETVKKNREADNENI